MSKCVVVIPARGGSKGIPRKNLRPIAGFPLIYYSITAALKSKLVSRVIVSTDDDEIALFAERFGADVMMRDPALASDAVTLDPVIADAVARAESEFKESYDYVVTVQPTSPLVRPMDIDNVFQLLAEGKCDSVVSVVDDRHLTWTIQNGKAKPNYAARVNRQELPDNYKETGAVIGCVRKQLIHGTRIGENVNIYKMPHEISHDIDTYADLYLCEAMLSRKKVVFAVVGYAEVGLGHAFRAVLLAHELVQCDILFICEESSQLAADYIKSNNYTVQMCANGKLADSIIDAKPALLINDLLDTDISYMSAITQEHIKVINFEDLGAGTTKADLVINALYPHQEVQSNWLVGPAYFCLRDEFLYLNEKYQHKQANQVRHALISFGGVDEGDLTLRAVKEISPHCIDEGILITVIIGPGYKNTAQLSEYLDSLERLESKLIQFTKRISDHMCEADIAITSGGRTVLELASLKIPMIVVCQNERETTHTFAAEENGVVNLGYRKEVKDGVISSNFSELCQDTAKRQQMIKKMEQLDLTKGKMRVIKEIKALIEQHTGSSL